MAKHKITFTGFGDRVITKADFAAVDIEAPGTLKWVQLHPAHQPSVIVENISDDLLEYFSRTDDGFDVEEVNAEVEAANTSKQADKVLGEADKAALEAAANSTEGTPDASPDALTAGSAGAAGTSVSGRRR